MGPNVATLFDELCRNELPRRATDRSCDLGCGSGLSSLIAADCFPGTIYAVDSWNTPEQSRERFDRFAFGTRIEAVQASGLELMNTVQVKLTVKQSFRPLRSQIAGGGGRSRQLQIADKRVCVPQIADGHSCRLHPRPPFLFHILPVAFQNGRTPDQ